MNSLALVVVNYIILEKHHRAYAYIRLIHDITLNQVRLTIRRRI